MSDAMFQLVMKRHVRGVVAKPTFLLSKLPKYSPGDLLCESIGGNFYCFTIKYRFWDRFDRL